MDTFSKKKKKWNSVEISECIIVGENIFIRVGIGIDYRTIDNKCVLARKKMMGEEEFFKLRQNFQELKRN